MKKVGFKAKLWSTVAFVWVGLVAICVIVAWSDRKLMLAEKQEALRGQVESALSVIDAYVQREEKGELSRAEAQRATIGYLRAIRYGTAGYIGIVDKALVQVLLPFKPEAEGKSADNVDSTGKHFTRDLVQHGFDGTHITHYLFPKPGAASATPEPKMAYSAAVPNWNWVVYSGVYLDDVEEEFRDVVLRLALLGMLIGGALTIAIALIVRGVTATLGGDPLYASSLCERVADGDLTEAIAVASGDAGSLLASLKRMQQHLAQSIRGIYEAADAVTAASREIADGNIDLSARTEEQAAAISQTAASMDSITSAVTSDAQRAEHASALAASVSQTVDEGGEVVTLVVSSMDAIAETSSEIEQIVVMIENIAVQTNLLALNAAVEAARAGDQGRGFAVVAAEVRSLALRSANAAKDVKLLIGRSAAKVATGRAYAHEAGGVMTRIRGAVSSTVEIIDQISHGARAQTARIEEARIAIGQIDSATQQNAALVEQSTAAAASLAHLAGDMKQSVAVFRVSAHAMDAIP